VIVFFFAQVDIAAFSSTVRGKFFVLAVVWMIHVRIIGAVLHVFISLAVVVQIVNSSVL
jgi:hypothetical protein